MKKNVFALMVLAITLIVGVSSFGMTTFNAYAEDEKLSEDFIKVGIRYGDNAVPLTTLKSNTGLVLGYDVEDAFNVLMDFTDYDEIIVRNDGYFMKLNDYFYVYDFNETTDADNDLIQGPIHVQIGDNFESLNSASDFIEDYAILEEDAFLYFDNGWKVWFGNFKTYSQAELALEDLKLNFSQMDFKIISKSTTRVQVCDQSGQILLAYKPNNQDYLFKSIENSEESIGLISVDNKKYRGNILLKKDDENNIVVVNYLALNEYLYGVLPLEVNSDWTMAALKAQAVAARNYAIYNNRRHEKEGFSICSSTHCQVYGGFEKEKTRTNLAVDETDQIIMTYNELPISAYYHHSSGGYTENSENIWSEPIPYIKAVLDPFSAEDDSSYWKITYTTEELDALLETKGYSIGAVTDVKVKRFSEFGSVLSLELVGTEDSLILDKNNMRTFFGYNQLKSTNFSIKKVDTIAVARAGFTKNIEIKDLKILNKNNTISEVSESLVTINGQNDLEIITFDESKPASQRYIFIGAGWGHRLGMSQIGSKNMGEQGYTFEEILKFYFKDIEIKRYQ